MNPEIKTLNQLQIIKDIIDTYRDRLSVWEFEFLSSIYSSLEFKPLTEKQFITVKMIWKKYYTQDTFKNCILP